MSRTAPSTSKMATFSKGAFKFGKRLVFAVPVIPMWTVAYVGLFSIVLAATLRPNQEN